MDPGPKKLPVRKENMLEAKEEAADAESKVSSL